MQKLALIIFSNLEGSGRSAIYRAMMFAQELRQAGDDVIVLFDGGGSVAASQLAEVGHSFHALFEDVRPSVRGVCRYCARAYGVADALIAANVALIGDDRGHASLRGLLLEGRQLVTF